ncbi:MAG: hypothetical protein IH995_01285 [Proteobacteria bacterium]|nr:hypothetical protein [Pseudomonadota bacterium]
MRPLACLTSAGEAEPIDDKHDQSDNEYHKDDIDHLHNHRFPMSPPSLAGDHCDRAGRGPRLTEPNRHLPNRRRSAGQIRTNT